MIFQEAPLVAKRNLRCYIGTSRNIDYGGVIMAVAVKISDELANKAKVRSKVYKRSLAGQIEYWAALGELVEDNPSLPLSFLQDVLLGREQIKADQGTPYVFGEGE